MAAGQPGVNGRPVQNRAVEEHKGGQDLAPTLNPHTAGRAVWVGQRSPSSATNKHVQVWRRGSKIQNYLQSEGVNKMSVL